jgi:hypothetical protein
VALDRIVRVTFSEPVDEAAISSTTFTIDHGVTGTYSFNANTVTFTPSAPFEYMTTYHVTLTTGITDTAGNKLARNYTWSFTTTQDPEMLPPTVLSTTPEAYVYGISIDSPVTVTFSKDLDTTTITTATFAVDHGVTGTVTYANRVATFTPDNPLEYMTTYTATVTTGVTDTSGNHMAARYTWQFTTQPDPSNPVVNVTSPGDSAIIGDSLLIIAEASHPLAAGIDSVQFLLDDVPIAVDNTPPYEYEWDASGLDTSSIHFIGARAFGSDGRVGFAVPRMIFYQWQELATDYDAQAPPQDILRLLGRTTDSTFELRYEFARPWTDPVNDTLLELGVYIDADQNEATGRLDFAGNPLNGIGADYLVIMGIHSNEPFSRWNAGTAAWDSVYSLSEFPYLYLPSDSKVLEFGLRWSDVGNSNAVNIVSINVYFVDGDGNFVADWLPNAGSGYITIRREDRYIGTSRVNPFSATRYAIPEKRPGTYNPFR